MQMTSRLTNEDDDGNRDEYPLENLIIRCNKKFIRREKGIGDVANSDRALYEPLQKGQT